MFFYTVIKKRKKTSFYIYAIKMFFMICGAEMSAAMPNLMSLTLTGTDTFLKKKLFAKKLRSCRNLDLFRCCNN